jgi:hypothetical protein
MVGSQIGNLTLCPSFGHNLHFKYPNGSCETILDIYISKSFQICKFFFNPMSFDPLRLPFEDLKVHRKSNSQSGSSFGNVVVHSLTFSYTLRSMKCDSQAPLLACTFANLCLGHKPKARVVT